MAIASAMRPWRADSSAIVAVANRSPAASSSIMTAADCPAQAGSVNYLPHGRPSAIAVGDA
jgi:hypothetical protein